MWTLMERHQASRQLHSKGWVSLLGASKILGISYPTIQKMKREEKIVTTHVGTHRVDRNELLRVAKERGIAIDILIGRSSPSSDTDDSPDFNLIQEE